MGSLYVLFRESSWLPLVLQVPAKPPCSTSWAGSTGRTPERYGWQDKTFNSCFRRIGACAFEAQRLRFPDLRSAAVLTALENTEFTLLLQGVTRQVRKERVEKLFAEIGLEGLENRRPAELSGGQQQRVAVARAMVTEPALILADEPTANLDSATAISLLDVMERLNRTTGTTFIFSTHDPQVMERAHRLIHLRDGQIVGDEARDKQEAVVTAKKDAV